MQGKVANRGKRDAKDIPIFSKLSRLPDRHVPVTRHSWEVGRFFTLWSPSANPVCIGLPEALSLLPQRNADYLPYFHRKWTNTRPKLFESFSTRW
jgi:hypothetical protein